MPASDRPERDHHAVVSFINGRHRKPHSVGRDANDCVGYALAAVSAQIGVDVLPKLKWHDLRSAAKIIKKYGSLESAFDAHFDRVPPAFAHRGDIAGVEDPDFGIHPMIVEGRTLVGPGENGNRRLPRSAMRIAWSAHTYRERGRRKRKTDE